MTDPLLRTSDEHLERLLSQLRAATKPRTVDRDCLIAHLEKLCDQYGGYESAKSEVEHLGDRDGANG